MLTFILRYQSDVAPSEALQKTSESSTQSLHFVASIAKYTANISVKSCKSIYALCREMKLVILKIFQNKIISFCFNSYESLSTEIDQTILKFLCLAFRELLSKRSLRKLTNRRYRNLRTYSYIQHSEGGPSRNNISWHNSHLLVLMADCHNRFLLLHCTTRYMWGGLLLVPTLQLMSKEIKL